MAMTKIEKHIKAFNCVMSLIIVHEMKMKNKADLKFVHFFIVLKGGV